MAIEGRSLSIRDLIMGDNRPFYVPIYQRSYMWPIKDLLQNLLDDILDFATESRGNDNGEYYLGNIIIKEHRYGGESAQIVVDGQQRITTTILMLCAIRDIYLQDRSNDDDLRSAREIGLQLYREDGGLLRIKLNNMEHQKTLNVLLSGNLEAIGASDRVTSYWRNYQYIRRRFAQLRAEGDWRLADFPAVLDRVKIVRIGLSKDQDENSVFESINSRNMPLSGPDLIKNFIFTFRAFGISRDQEQQLVLIYTEKFESLFPATNKQEDEKEAFFREYIAVKTGEKVRKDPKTVYYAFKKWVGVIEGYEHCRRVILDLVKWGIIFVTLRSGAHPDIDRNILGYIRASFFTYAALLMDMADKLGKVEEGRLIIYDKHHFNRALRSLVVYDVSRFLGGRAAKAIARFIPTIPKVLEEADPNYPQDYAGAFSRHVTAALQGYGQPNPAAVQRAVYTLDLYANQKQLLRFLVLLENLGQNEQISFEDGLRGCEIEHIMPQTLDAGWQHIDESEHQRYLHTLGNLSITFDNQSLRNLSFAVKKQRLAERSRVRLNQMLLEYDEFGGEQIRDRASKMLRRFFAAFDVPFADSDGVDDDPEVRRYDPHLWLEKVRQRTDAQELHSLRRAATWKSICEHLGIEVGQDSAHRRLEGWIQEHKPFWPSTW